MIQQALTGAITAIFLVVVVTYYALLLKKKRIRPSRRRFASISVLIPAHNEERYIDECIKSVQAARFAGKKEIIVIVDGAKDRTARIARKHAVTVIEQEHSGKSHSLNMGLRKASGELIAVVDADSIIHEDSLERCAALIGSEKVGIVCSTVKVHNRKSFIGMWLHIEQLYNSLLRSLFAKVNVNIVAPGPLSVYKRNVLDEIGGFETKGYSEDVDVAVRTIRHGYVVEHAERAVSETNMPITPKGFFRQRIRFARGWTNILRRHLRLDHTFWQIFTLPLALFWYLQAVIMGVITLYNLLDGYQFYFLSKGIVFDFAVARYFFEWLSLAGVIRWAYSIFSGAVPVGVIDIISLTATLLTYPLYVYAVIKFDGRFTWWHAIPIFFMFPFWLVIMFIYILSIPEYFNKHQRNIWVK